LAVTQVPQDAINSSATESLTNKALLHELQLGEQLNESVQGARRADFSLMLAMLCDDVREQSQFILPKQSIADISHNDEALRKQFDLPDKAPLALKKLSQIAQYNQAQTVADNQLASLHLSDALGPKALAFRDNAKHVSHDVITNTTVVCQQKHAAQQPNPVLNKTLAVNVNAWLKNVQTSIVKAKLIDELVA